jgi:hypothetical protein
LVKEYSLNKKENAKRKNLGASERRNNRNCG